MMEVMMVFFWWWFERVEGDDDGRL